MARQLTITFLGDSTNAQRAIDDLGDKAGDLQSKSRDMKGALDGIGEGGGNAEQGLQGVADLAGFAAEQFGLSIGPTEDLARNFADLGGGVEAVANVAPAFAGAIRNLPGMILSLVGPTWAYVAALTAQAVAFIAANAPLIALIAGIALLAAGIVLLITHWDTIVQKVPFLQTALDAVKTAIEGVKNFIVDNLVPALGSLITEVRDNVTPVLTAFGTFITGTVIPFLTTLWNFFKDNILPILKDVVELGIKPIQLQFELLSTAINTVVKPAFEAIWGFFRDTLLPGFNNVKDVVLPALQKAFETVANFITDTVIPKFKDLWNFFKDDLIPFIQKVIDKFTGASGLKWAMDTAKGAVNGLRDAFGFVKDKVGEVIGKIQDLIGWINSIPGIPDVGGIGGDKWKLDENGNIVPNVEGNFLGGRVKAGVPTIVGEHGRPELFVPDSAGRIISNAELMAGVRRRVAGSGPRSDSDTAMLDNQRSRPRGARAHARHPDRANDRVSGSTRMSNRSSGRVGRKVDSHISPREPLPSDFAQARNHESRPGPAVGPVMPTFGRRDFPGAL